MLINSAIRPLAAGLLVGTCMTTPALAQQVDVAAASSGGFTDEIVVTASRREQSIQDIPYNISAVGAQALERNGVSDFASLIRLTPGVAYIDRGPRDAGAANNLIIRGIGTRGANGLSAGMSNVPTVSTYLDETPLYVNLSIKDIERVEVLRGPQGTLYGSGAAGGTLRFIYNKPSTAGFSGSVSGSVSATKEGDPSRNIDAVLNIPLSETLAFRASGGYERQGGFVDQPFFYKRTSRDGPPVMADPSDIVNSAPIIERVDDANDAKILYGRASLRYQPTADVDIQANYQYQRNKVSGAPSVNPGYLGNDDYDGSERILERLSSTAHLGNLDASVDFGFATLTSATSYYDSKVDSVRDNTRLFEDSAFGVLYTGSPRFIADALDRQTERGFIQEVRLASNGDQPLNYILGAFYQNIKRRIVLDDRLPGYSEWRRAQGENPFGGPLPSDFDLPGDSDFIANEQQRFKEYALFGELTYKLTDAWQITGGARVFWQKFRSDADFLLPQSEILFGPGEGSATGAGRSSISDQIFKLNTSYDFSRDLMVYATFAQGFRRGGSNALPTVGPFGERPSLNLYRPDTLDNYEIGVKGRIARRLNFTLSAFHIDWKDIQLNTATVAAAQPFVANGGKARSQGVELELIGNLTDALSVQIGYAYTDAKLTEDFEIRTLNIGNGNSTGSVSVSGEKGSPTPGTPKHSFTVGADYRQELNSDWSLVYHVNGSYRSRILRNLTSDRMAAYWIKGFSTWDASLSLESDAFTASLFADNIFNEKGVSAVAGNNPDTVSRLRSFFIQRPITVGLRAAYRWGR